MILSDSHEERDKSCRDFSCLRRATSHNNFDRKKSAFTIQHVGCVQDKFACLSITFGEGERAKEENRQKNFFRHKKRFPSNCWGYTDDDNKKYKFMVIFSLLFDCISAHAYFSAGRNYHEKCLEIIFLVICLCSRKISSAWAA